MPSCMSSLSRSSTTTFSCCRPQNKHALAFAEPATITHSPATTRLGLPQLQAHAAAQRLAARRHSTVSEERTSLSLSLSLSTPSTSASPAGVHVRLGARRREVGACDGHAASGGGELRRTGTQRTGEHEGVGCALVSFFNSESRRKVSTGCWIASERSHWRKRSASSGLDPQSTPLTAFDWWK
jgi:hypothetical protein